ncbi:MAG: SDR family oxidoreductase [Chloroflexi bacterium]|nr:SDR family oxidoreductase [Chloroflexota bacterium]
MDLGVKGSSVFISGGGEGIGKKVALMLAEEEADIAVADIDYPKAESTANEVKQLGARALSFQLDVTNQDQVNEVIQKTLDEFKKIDILVNVPGRGERKSFLETTRDDWDFSVHLNLYGPLNCTRAVINHMVEQKRGKIATVISDAAKVGEPRNCVYAAAKAGVVAFTKSLAQEVGRYGINVNCISLGATNTPGGIRSRADFIKMAGGKMTEEEFLAKVVKAYPLGRLGEVEDAANAICFLVSDRAAFITGQTLSVSGGYSMVS